jgi:acetyltransferase
MQQVGKAVRRPSKPVVAVMMATEEFHEEVRKRDDLPPVYEFPESAARALAQLYKYSAFRQRPADESIPEFEVDDAAVAEILAQQGEGYLPDGLAFKVLELYGVPIAKWREVTGSVDASVAAEGIGYPVVVKAVGPELVHKSDLGAVKVDLRSSSELETAMREIRAKLEGAGIENTGFLLQELGRGGHEVIFGITTDARFGPLLMFGLGGKYVEVLRDVRFGVPPLTPQEAREMIRGIQGFPLLEGVRGEAGADLELLEEILLRIAQLTERHPTIQELDINPFVAGDRESAKALDVRIRVAPVDA